MLKSFLHYLIAIGAYWFYGRPARKLIVIGVTGTKGKSTTCRLIASVLESGSYKVANLSTVEINIAGIVIPDKPQMTMLGRGLIQKYLRRAVKAGCRYAVIETSSEGIMQYRHLGLEYDVAVFTNLGTEHQERHGGFENLKKAKGKLFASLTNHPRKTIAGKDISKISIVNADDPNAEFFASFPADEKYSYSLKSKITNLKSKISCNILKSDGQDTIFEADGFKYKLNIIGAFNVPNALAAIAVGRSQGIGEEDIKAGLASVINIPGRMEFIDVGQDFSVVVDYAHEPMSLTALFSALRPLLKGAGKLVGIIGSDGGGRDLLKRPKMGEIAGRLCDIVIVTDVNPWDEDPRSIAAMISAGVKNAGKTEGVDLFINLNRLGAIKQACALAGAGGAVAITAKGTEPFIIGPKGLKTPWSDAEAALLAINEFLSGFGEN